MGQYKVPQNVEAEDHILGALTFRQFIFAMIGFGWAAICFAIFRKIPAVMILLGFPPTLLLMLLAFYTRDGQNFEQILIAMVGFFAASRKRYWVKEEITETYRVEPAKHIAEVTQRNPDEVMGELEKLSTLIDSRGWNKPPDIATSQIVPATKHEDRIVAPPAPHAPEEPKTDMLDAKSPLAQNLSELLQNAAEDVREEAMNQMTTRPTAAAKRALTAAQNSVNVGMTPAQSGDILKLATQSDDISVSQVAAQATRINPAAPVPGTQNMEAQQGGQ
jgi:PrgI family protein